MATYSADITFGKSVTGTFTASDGNAALIDDNTATSGADATGLSVNTVFRVDFATPVSIQKLTISKNGTNGFTNAATMKLEYSDDDSNWTQAGNNFVIAAGTGTTAEVYTFPLGTGAHRYWRIKYVSGTTGGNAWIRELEMMSELPSANALFFGVTF